jgi:hypothetical protein
MEARWLDPKADPHVNGCSINYALEVKSAQEYHCAEPHALVNIKGYILQQKQKCSFNEISV